MNYTFSLGIQNLYIEDKIVDIFDEMAENKIGQKKQKIFGVDFIDGAEAFGIIEKKTARLQSIDAPRKENRSSIIRGTYTYERILTVLCSMNINYLRVINQSNDSIYVLKKLVDEKILYNPTNFRGISVAEYPTSFSINKEKLLLKVANKYIALKPLNL